MSAPESSQMQYETIAKKLKISGIVQGVGFRPYVYQQALLHEVTGEVANTPSGVFIHVEGKVKNVDSFCRNLSSDIPRMAYLTDIAQFSDKVLGFQNFSIRPSTSGLNHSALISPDISVCDECLREMLDPLDRRHGYPFINCTNCGPRYTIIESIPYDRPMTSMKSFVMCKKCQEEYDDPKNRRFHAQPNACSDCGPSVHLFDSSGIQIECKNHIAQAALFLKQGKIIAIKGLGGFHLCADALNSQAVTKLRRRKYREEKPFAVMALNLEAVDEFAVVSSEEKELLVSYRRPVVLLKKKDPFLLSPEVSPGNALIGVMLPYTPIHYLLLAHGFKALVMTSANISKEPIVIDNSQAFERLSGIADFFLTHDRDIYLRCDDSVVRYDSGALRLVRRSRGFSPVPVFLRKDILQVLGCGAELKNTVCLTKGSQAFLSQHIGDLENPDAYDYFQMTIEHMKKILNITPGLLACDLHPDYLSTRYALEQNDIDIVQVQHHHAHIVSCMAENNIEGNVIGLAFDGTGFGKDGAIWGGEFLIADEKKYSRTGHLSYMSLPGGAAAIKEPWRMAVSYLHEVFGDEMLDLNIPVIREIEDKRLFFIRDMLIKRINCPKTSSMGRFFDAVAAITGIRYTVSYEGQAAVELEMLADCSVTDCYPFDLTSDGIYQIMPHAIIHGLVEDIEKKVAPSVVSAKFHNTVISMSESLCLVIRKETDINRVALSGGVFQNSYLLNGIIKELVKNRFEVFSHRNVPSNDGGISLGQAVCAASLNS